MDRRQFLSGSVAGLAAAAGQGAAAAAPQQIGRPVRAVSIGFKPGLSLERMAALVEAEAAAGTDIVALPETWRGQSETSAESLDGPSVTALSAVAAKHRTYVVCPIDRKDGAARFNSAVLIDRRGQVAGVYDKVYPYHEEFNKVPELKPGQAAGVFATDFGRIGLAICFDANWPHLWHRMADLGAELVIWPSAYSAGRTLQARATDYNYYVMSATWTPDCLVYDLDGEQLLYDHANRSAELNVTRHTFDLDRCLFHQDFNVPKLKKLLSEHAEDVEQEKWLKLEGWFLLKARRAGVSARELARKYGMEERRHYINRSTFELDKRRGWQFS